MKYLFLEDASYYSGILGSAWLDNNKDRAEFSGARHYKEKISFFKKYTAVISIQYLWPLCNLVIFKANAAGVNTVLFTDGIVDWENCHSNPHVLASGLKLYNPIVHQVFACPGVFESSLFHINGLPFTPQKILPKKEKVSMPDTLKKTILLTTANTPYFSAEEKSRLKKIIREIIISSPHGLILRVFDEALIDFEEARLLRNERLLPFEDVLEEVDAVISTPSSIILTSMLAGKPTCQMIYRDTPILLQSGWMIHRSCSVLQALNSLVSAEEERMIYQRKIVSQNYPSESIESILLKPTVSSSPGVDYLYNNTLLRVIESPFNFNIEFFLRKAFRAIKLIFKR